MSKTRRSLPAVAFLLFLASVHVSAQSRSAPNEQIPEDTAKTYRVAVSAFQGEGLSKDNEYLLQAIPLLLLQTISGIARHHFDNVELAAYRRSVLESAVEAQRVQIDKLFQDRSKILFSSGNLATALAASTKTIDAAEERLSFLEKLDPTKISVERTKPIELVQSPSGEQLVSYPSVSPEHTAADLKLGLLVWGSIDEVQGFLVVHISVYDAALGRNIYDFGKAFTQSNVLDSASEVSSHLARAVLGRDFGTLHLEISPPSALVYLDGAFYGIGSSTIDHVKTGNHTVEVRAPGYAPESFSVSITPFGDTKESVSLLSVARPEIAVSSTPGGADVYVASEWKGKTPLLIARPSNDEAMVLTLKGYHNYTTTLSDATPKSLQARLLPELFDSQSYAAGLRNRFYSSFGAFALSMILPVTFYSIMQEDLVNLGQTNSVTEAQQLQNQIGVWYYSYLGGAFVSAALFANTIIDIAQYLRAIR